MYEVYVILPDGTETLIVYVEKERKVAEVKRLVVKQYDRGNSSKYYLYRRGEVLNGTEEIEEGIQYNLKLKRLKRKKNEINKGSVMGE